MEIWYIAGGIAAYTVMGCIMIGAVIGAHTESVDGSDTVALVLIALLWPFVLAVVIGAVIVGWFKGRALVNAMLIEQALKQKDEGQSCGGSSES